MKSIGEVTKKVVKNDSKLEGRICALERLVGKLKNWAEKAHGVDVDEDGKIGNMRIALAVFLVACIAGFTFAVTQDVDNWSSGSGLTGTAILSNDGSQYILTVDSVVADVTGAQAVIPNSTDSTATVVLTSASYGSTVMLDLTNTIAVTLPANGAAAGSWLEVAVTGDDDTAPTISAATADTLIGPNDPDLDSVTWATGHRINAVARFWSDGSFWHVQNLGGTTMTYTD